jgi:hypothetical protein
MVKHPVIPDEERPEEGDLELGVAGTTRARASAQRSRPVVLPLRLALTTRISPSGLSEYSAVTPSSLCSNQLS